MLARNDVASPQRWFIGRNASGAGGYVEAESLSIICFLSSDEDVIPLTLFCPRKTPDPSFNCGLRVALGLRLQVQGAVFPL
jgi:hypothetical protein